MTDVVDRATRSRMMSGIRGINTRPELLVRKALFAMGFRYRLHDRRLPGKPDIVLPRYHAVIFVHGCFWHGHGCHLFRWPQTNQAFWKEKICANQTNDKRNLEALENAGWRVAVVWECALKASAELPLGRVTRALSDWIRSSRRTKVIASQEHDAYWGKRNG